MSADANLGAQCLALLGAARRWMGARAIAARLNMGQNPAPVALALHDLYAQRMIQRIRAPAAEARLLYAAHGVPVPPPQRLAAIALQSQSQAAPRVKARPASKAPQAPEFTHETRADGRISISGAGVLIDALDPQRLYRLRREISHALKDARLK
ncbi:MAG TPA: hypothetical protein VNM24_00355 [Burkholderiales bacterium]|nr:hypothetical protein [Burkholderiales bacterium]